ncbi:MAG: type II toxin-antitoxin system RelE/ParE family toxin [Pseudomonadota bacterium]
MAYRVHVVSPAKREIKKLDRSGKVAVLKANLSLGENPRPDGYVPVVTQFGLYRIHVPSAPKYRIIYHVDDRFQAVIIVTVRLKGKRTYQNIPIHSLSLKLEELKEEFLKQQEESNK